jgi:hypothetical protein
VIYDGTPVLLDGISRPHQSPVELADHSNPCERQHGARTSISGRKSAPSILHGRYDLDAGTGGNIHAGDINGQAHADSLRLVSVP